MAKTELDTRTDLGASLPAEDKVGDISRLLGESKDMLAARVSAHGRLLGRDLPDRVKHLWTFTDPRHMLPGDPVPERSAASAVDVSDTAVAGAEVPDGAAALIVLRPGGAPVVNLAPSARAAGLVAAPITNTLGLSGMEEGEDERSSGLFHDLNTALWNCGVHIELPRGAILVDPVLVIVQAGSGSTLPRLVVDVREGANLTVVEKHTGGCEGARILGRTELSAAEGARLNHVLIQRWESGVNGHLTVRGYADRDADLLTVFASLGGDRAKVDLFTDLIGEGARSEMRGIALAAANQRFDHHTSHRHKSGHTWSNIDFKAVADDDARSSYTGLIRIEETARESEAFQENRNLLLSDTGRADSIPELEILNEDVSCSHGATVAPVDPEQLFYLQSRGLDADEALRLVVQGFLGQTLDRLPQGVRETVAAIIGSRLETNRGGEAA